MSQMRKPITVQLTREQICEALSEWFSARTYHGDTDVCVSFLTLHTSGGHSATVEFDFISAEPEQEEEGRS